MSRPFSSRARAGALVVALALVGGAGCVTMSVVERVQERQRVRQMDEARERRIRELTTAAEAGAPTAKRALAFALMTTPGPTHADMARIQSLLERAGALGDVSAQVALAEMLASGALPAGSEAPLPQGIADRARGIALLQRAAPLACRIWVMGDPEGAAYGERYNLDRPPTLLAAQFLEKAGREDEARLWRARDMLHCGVQGAGTFEAAAANPAAPAPQRRTALAMLLLAEDRERERIRRLESRMAPDDVAAARREADGLRRRIAASEQDFPAPTRPTLP